MTTSRNLGPDELQATEVKVLSLVQKERFGEKLKLPEGENLSKRLQLTGGNIKSLGPFKSGGLLRVGGRLKYAPLPFDIKHPIILPIDHFVTRLIGKYYQMAKWPRWNALYLVFSTGTLLDYARTFRS